MAPCDCCLLHRVKSFTFKEREVTIAIPKPLLLADIIVWLQMTKNDVCARVCVCVCVCAVSLYCRPCYASSTAHFVWSNTVLVCMCCIVQGICLKPVLAVTVIHCWSSGLLTTSCSPRSPKWLVGTHCTSTGPPTAYWGWTSTWVGRVGLGWTSTWVGGVDKMADQWMSTRDLMKVFVCVCVCVRACVCVCVCGVCVCVVCVYVQCDVQ